MVILVVLVLLLVSCTEHGILYVHDVDMGIEVRGMQHGLLGMEYQDHGAFGSYCAFLMFCMILHVCAVS